MKKRILALFIVFTVCVTLLGACTSSKETSGIAAETAAATKAASEQASSTTDSATSDNLVTGQGFEAALEARVSYDLPIAKDGQSYTEFVTYSDDGNKDIGLANQQWLKDAGITIDLFKVPASVGSEKFNLMIASGDFYDILPTSASQILGSVDSGVDDGILLNFEPYMKELMPNYYMLVNCNDTYKDAIYSDAGNICNLATFYHEPYTADYGNIMRKDMLDGVGLEAPVTYDDWDKVLRAVKEKYNLTAALSIAQSGIGRNNTWVGGYGIAGEVSVTPMVSVPIYLEGDQVKFGATQDEFKEYLKMMNTWYKDGILYKDFYSNTAWQPNQDIITSSQCFCWQDDQKTIGEYQLSIADTNAKVYPVADPIKEVGSTKYYATSSRISENGCFLSTTVLDKDYTTLLKCADYAYSPESDIPLNYGIEGKSYNLNSEGEPEFTSLITDNPDGLNFNDALTVYVSTNELGGIVYYEKYDTTFSEAELASKTIWDRSAGEIKTIPTEASMTTEENEAYTNIMNDIATYSSEIILKFVIGEMDINTEWDTFVSTMNSMNLEEAIGYQQDAYDRYLAK